jgi:hypothetical protein
MNIVINEELQKYIDPLTPNEYAALERSLLAEGCRDALVLWGEVLIDGHNRYEICSKYDLPFKTVQNDSFKSLEDVLLWMIDNQLGRRSVSDFQRGMLALRKRDIIAARTKAEATPAKHRQRRRQHRRPPRRRGRLRPAMPLARRRQHRSHQDPRRHRPRRRHQQCHHRPDRPHPQDRRPGTGGGRAHRHHLHQCRRCRGDPAQRGAGQRRGRGQEGIARSRQESARAESRHPHPAPAKADGATDGNAIPLVEGQENELTATLRREIAALQARVSRLSEENQGLRAELALLKAGSDQQA